MSKFFIALIVTAISCTASAGLKRTDAPAEKQVTTCEQAQQELAAAEKDSAKALFYKRLVQEICTKAK